MDGAGPFLLLYFHFLTRNQAVITGETLDIPEKAQASSMAGRKFSAKFPASIVTAVCPPHLSRIAAIAGCQGLPGKSLQPCATPGTNRPVPASGTIAPQFSGGF